MHISYKFEQLIHSYIGKPDYVTYAECWEDRNERISLLFTICLIESDKHGDNTIGIKLQEFQENLFNDDEDKSISIDFLNFLNEIRNNKHK